MIGSKSSDALAPRWRPAPLLPREPSQDLLLVFVAAVLCFLASISIIAALGADRAAGGWADQLKDSATVLVRPGATETVDAAAERATQTLSGVKGVAEATMVEKEKAQALVEPWLGTGAALQDLPLPRMVSLQFDPRGPPAKGALEAALKTAGIDGVVDDHSLWIADIVRAGARARIAAISVAALIALAAGAVIAFATRAGLAARSDIVEVLHITGAKDSYIMGLFQSRLAELAGLAGAIGAAAAALVAAAARLMGGGEGLTPVLPIAWTDLLAVLPVPLIAAAVAAVAARLTAMRLIGELP